MPAAVVERERFDPAKHARRWTYLLDEERLTLYEVVGVKGVPGDERKPMKDAAVKLLDVAGDLPTDPFVALDFAAWIPVAEAEAFVVVVPSDGHNG